MARVVQGEGKPKDSCLKDVSLSGAGVSIPDSGVRKNVRKAGSAAVLTGAAQDQIGVIPSVASVSPSINFFY